MWALRRAFLPLRNRGFNVRASCIKSVSTTWVEDDSGTLESSRMAYGWLLLPNMFYHSGQASLKFTVSRCELSSQADARSTSDSEDGFSELETPASESGKDKFNDIKDGEEPHGELEFSDTKVEPENFKPIFKSTDSSPSTSQSQLGVAEIMNRQRHRRIQCDLSEWVELTRQQLKLTDGDFPKWRGPIAELLELHKAKMYIQSIPEFFKGETMKAEGIEPDIRKNAVLVWYYISAGLKRKAKDLLKKMEGENLKENSWLGRYLLPLYANLGKADEVGRIWEVCQASPQMEECLAAIEAFGKLEKIDEADAVFEMMSRRWKLSSKNYSVMLEVYVNNKMLPKGNDLVNQMANSGCQIEPEIFKPIDSSPSTSQLSEWVKLKSQLELTRRYKWRGPIAELLWLYKAEMYIQSISEFFKGETMKAEGIEPDIRKYAVLVWYYISAGLKRKAEDLLKEMEGENLKENSWLGRYLLPLYANLGKADEVGRIWEVCQASPQMEECLAAIESFGKLKKINEAEAVFEMVSRRWKLSFKNYSVMLEVYANNKMLAKGNDLIEQMADSGCQIDPFTWDDLVKLHIQAVEVEKAYTSLEKAIRMNLNLDVMERYAERGDVHNSEMMLDKMKKSGHTISLRQYEILLHAYINAKLPAYGIRERMKVDNIFPDTDFVNLLSQVDALKEESSFRFA